MSISHLVYEAVENAVDTTKDVVKDTVKDTAKDISKSTSNNSTGFKETLKNTILEHPRTASAAAILAALGVGAAGMHILKRRKKDLPDKEPSPE